MKPINLVCLGLLGVLAGAGVGCQGTDLEPVAEVLPYVMTDSAGIRLVISTRPSWAAQDAWSIASEPSVRIGVSDGPLAYQFHRIVGVTRLSDGRIVVLDGATSQLRFFSSTGEYLFSVGQSGQGPGEFQRPLHLERLQGDTLEVTDQLKRVRFAPNGALVLDESIPWERLRGIGRFLRESCPLPTPIFLDGYLLLCQGNGDVRFLPAVAGPLRLEGILARVTPLFESVDTLGTFLIEDAALWGSSGRLMYMPNPASARGVWAVGGHPVVYVHGDAYRYRLEMYDLATASLLMVLERPDGRVPVEAATLDSAWAYAERLPFFAGTNLSALRRQLPPIDSVSSVAGVTVDLEGALWVRVRSTASEGPWPWDVFAQDGIYLGRLLLPVGAGAHIEIGEDYLLAVVQDSLNVEFVQLYSLARRSNPY